MPLKEDPAFQDWSWFPHGSGKDFTFSKCLDPLEPLRDDLTVISGMSNEVARNSHGHNSAGQFLTGIRTGGRDGYNYAISLDQVYAAHIGEQTRMASGFRTSNRGIIFFIQPNPGLVYNIPRSVATDSPCRFFLGKMRPISGCPRRPDKDHTNKSVKLAIAR